MSSTAFLLAVYSAILICSESKSPKAPKIDQPEPATRCEPLRIPFCDGQSYRRATLPNLFNQSEQQDIALDALQFALLLQEKECRPALVNFLCIAYLPPCFGKVNKRNVQALPPCQELCQRAHTKCAARATQLGNPWPEDFNCNNFPKRSSGQCWKGFRSKRKLKGGRSKTKEVQHAPLALPLKQSAPQAARKSASQVVVSEDSNNGSGMQPVEVNQEISHPRTAAIGKIQAHLDTAEPITKFGASLQHDTPGRRSTSGEVSSTWVVNVKYKGLKDKETQGSLRSLGDSSSHQKRTMTQHDVQSLRLDEDRFDDMQSLLDAFQRWINEGRRLNREFNRKMEFLNN